MVAEDPRAWLGPVFEFHRADTFRKLLPLLILLGIFTAMVVWIEMDYLHLRDNHPLKNITLMHGLLGFAISMLLVFRTNTAYERWWEGRKLWGSLVNVSRNFALKLHSYLPAEEVETRQFYAKMLGVFSEELRLHLLREQTRLALDERRHPELESVDTKKHIPSQLVCLMVARLQQLQKDGLLTENQQLLLNPEVTAFMDICGACERIKNTPIPFTYTAFIKKFIVAYTITLPLGYPFVLSWVAVPVVVFIFYVLASLELIAEQIEDPFGRDRNDLPMDRISEMIGKDVRDILAG